MYLSKKVFGIVALTVFFSFAHSGIAMGGSDGLHQVNARTFGPWKGAVGLGGSVSADAWAFSRGDLDIGMKVRAPFDTNRGIAASR